MNDSKNLAIAVLSVTATILLVGVVLSGMWSPAPALANSQLDRGGDYIMLTGQFTQNSELVYVTDAAVQRMNIYSYESSRRQIILWDTIDLRGIFGANRR